MVNTPFRFNAANKAFFCCSVRLRKALVKYRGQNYFEHSFRNNIHVKISKYGVPLRAAYKKFSSLVERGKMKCENPQRPLGSYN